MGKDPDAIDRHIAEQRARIGQQIASLKGRVRADLRSVRDEAKGRVSMVAEEAKATMDVDSQMKEHPASILTGALGLGVVLGMIGGESSSRDGRAPSYGDGPSTPRGGSQGSLLGGLLGPALGSVSGTLTEELRQLIREGFASLRGEGPAARPHERRGGEAFAPDPAAYGGD